MTKVTIDRELLERVVKADASNGASSVDLVDGWKAMEQIRSILATPLTYHQRAIAELREECDLLRQQLAELQKRTCNKADAQSVVNAYTELWIAEEEVTKKLRTQLAEAHAALAEVNK